MHEPQRILVIADIHLRGPRRPGFTGKRLTGWLNWTFFRGRRYAFSRFDRFLELALAERPHAVAVAGDLTQLGMDDEIATVMDRLAVLPRAGIPVFFVPGNHDSYVTRDAVRAATDTALRWCADCGATIEPIAPRAVRVTTSRVQAVLLDQTLPTGWFMSWGELDGPTWSVLEGGAFRHDGPKAHLILGHYPLRWPNSRPLPPTAALLQASRLEAIVRAPGGPLYAAGHIHHPFAIPVGHSAQVVPGSLTATETFAELRADGAEWTWRFRRLPEETAHV